MISLKKYLDMDLSARLSGEPDPKALLKTIVAAYRSALLAIGKSGARACPAVGSDLQQNLASLENRLSGNIVPSLIEEVEQQVEDQLQQWGVGTAKHFKTKANEVKELLIVLARTAESVGERDQRYTNQFSQFTSRLQTIADLDDLTQVRSSIVRTASELKTYVDQMAEDSHKSVVQLKAEISTYETKLKAAEELAVRDVLTGLANRRYVEERIELRIAEKRGFCVVIVDLNTFKQVNDTYGHHAGDSLLKQFAAELRSNVRTSDIVGRWGGDEFILVLDCDLTGAKTQIERTRKWVFGDYTLPLGNGTGEVKVKMDASIGVAQLQLGETMEQVIGRADAEMYKEKQLAKAAQA